MILPIYKGKGNPIECGFYRGIFIVGICYESGGKDLRTQNWQQSDIDDMHFGFMNGKGTTDAIFIVKQMQAKSRAKGKKLYFGFVDLVRKFLKQ